MRLPTLRNAVQWIVGTMIVLYTLLVYALNNSSVQAELGRLIRDELEAKIHSEVEIGRVEIGLLNSLSLHDVRIKDRNGKLLMSSGLLFAKLRIRALLEQKIHLRNIAILDTDIHIYKERSHGPTNIQYIIDAFSSQDNAQDSRLDLRINSFVMRRGSLTYDVWDRPTRRHGLFSPHHIKLSDIDAGIALKHLTNDSLSVRVRQLSARESCGWTLRKLNLRFEANRRECTLRGFELSTAHSTLTMDYLHAAYDLDARKNLLSTLSTQVVAKNWTVGTEDLSPLSEKLKKIDRTFRLSGRFVYVPTEIIAHDFNLSERRKEMKLSGTVRLCLKENKPTDLNVEALDLSANKELINNILSTFVSKDIPILEQIGDIALKGKGGYNFTTRSPSFDGKLHTDLGSLNVNLRYGEYRLRGKVSSADLNLAVLRKQPYMPTSLNFEMDGNVRFVPQRFPDGKVNIKVHSASLPRQELRDIKLALSHQDRLAIIDIDSHDPSADLGGTIQVRLNDKNHPKSAQAAFDIRRFVPSAFGYTPAWAAGGVGAQVAATLNSFDFKHPEGNLSVRRLNIGADRGAPSYHLRELMLRATPHPKGTNIRLDSDFADAAFTGTVDPQQIRNAVNRWLNAIAPHEGTVRSSQKATGGGFSFAAQIKRTDFFRHFLGLDLTLPTSATLEGALTGDGGNMRFTGSLPEFGIGDLHFKGVSISARSTADRLSLLAKAQKPMGNAALHAELHAESDGGQWNSTLQWDERLHHKFYGRINTLGRLQLPLLGSGRRLQFDFDLLPTVFRVNDSLWMVDPGNIALDARRFAIRHVAVRHADQRLAVSGTYAKGGEGIIADLHKVDVGALISLTGLEAVTFGGKATGRAIVKPDENNNPRLSAFLDIPGFHFNNTHLGHARVKGSFETGDQTINLQAHMTEGNVGQTDVAGFVSLGHKNLDLRVKSEATPIGFLNHYISDIFHNIRGRATGECRIYGGFKSLDFEGRERATASAQLPINGVTYHLNDADIELSSGLFRLNRAQLTDSLRGTGEVSGSLFHRHLRDMRYDFGMTGKNMLLYDRPYEDDLPFYATAYGTGNVSLKGEPGRLDVNMNLRTDPGSVLTYVLDRPDNSDTKLLTFRDASPKDTTLRSFKEKPEHEEEGSGTNIRLNMQVEVDPSGTLRMITDKKSGDVITVHGAGPIQATYFNKGDFQMYGTYNILRGTYDLSIQNLIKKTFTLHPGGTVVFAGNPLNADVNVLANYLVTSASLADLNVGGNFSNNTTPVNCLITFTGKVSNMNLSLDFDLPNVSEDEKMMVRNLIASDEERTTQVLYLLSMGRFFTYNYGGTLAAASQSQSEVMMKSLLAGTLSSQINSIISNALGNSNWSFGTNVSTGQLGWSDMEVDGLLSGRLLDNRLLFNGKVGYHDRQAATTNFVGDFDAQYLLTPRGGWSLRAYSETNNRYFSRTSLTTQGLGVQFKHDFDSFFDFLRRKRKSLQPSKAPKPKQ